MSTLSRGRSGRTRSNAKSPGRNNNKRPTSKGSVKSLKLALPNVKKVPPAVQETCFKPLRIWVQQFWREQTNKSQARQLNQNRNTHRQVEIDRMIELATKICIDNYTAQFRTMMLKVHEDCFRILATSVHRVWESKYLASMGTSKSDAVTDDKFLRQLLNAARLEYVEVIRRLATINKITAFHDCNEPRDSLAISLLAKVKHHLLEKKKPVYESLKRLLGDPVYEQETWNECFPNPNDKPFRVEASLATVAYEGSGQRHWHQKQDLQADALQELASKINDTTPTSRPTPAPRAPAVGRPRCCTRPGRAGRPTIEPTPAHR